MKIPGLLICCLLFIASSFSQEEQEKIKWQEGRPLTWEDFKAEPDTTLSYSANTNSGISYTWNYSTATGVPVLEHEVFTNFYPNKSWVQKDIHDEDYLLKHEQLQILRNIRQDLKRIYNRIESERVEMQNKFDRETSHSENKDAEMKWREFIKQELKKLAKYSS